MEVKGTGQLNSGWEALRWLLDYRLDREARNRSNSKLLKGGEWRMDYETEVEGRGKFKVPQTQNNLREGNLNETRWPGLKQYGVLRTVPSRKAHPLFSVDLLTPSWLKATRRECGWRGKGNGITKSASTGFLAHWSWWSTREGKRANVGRGMQCLENTKSMTTSKWSIYVYKSKVLAQLFQTGC